MERGPSASPPRDAVPAGLGKTTVFRLFSPAPSVHMIALPSGERQEVFSISTTDKPSFSSRYAREKIRIFSIFKNNTASFLFHLPTKRRTFRSFCLPVSFRRFLCTSHKSPSEFSCNLFTAHRTAFDRFRQRSSPPNPGQPLSPHTAAARRRGKTRMESRRKICFLCFLCTRRIPSPSSPRQATGYIFILWPLLLPQYGEKRQIALPIFV